MWPYFTECQGSNYTYNRKTLNSQESHCYTTGHRVPDKLSVVLEVNDFNSHLQTYAACNRQRKRES